MKNLKKVLIETLIAIAVLTPIFVIGYFLGVELDKTGW